MPGGSKVCSVASTTSTSPCGGAEPLGDLAEIGRQIAGFVDQIDQILPDHALRRRGEGDRQLLGEMIAERDFGGDEGFEIVVLVAGGAAAPFGVGGRRGILRGARGGFRGLLGEDVVEPGVERLFDLGAGAEVAVHPFFLARLELAGPFAGGTGGIATGILAVAARNRRSPKTPALVAVSWAGSPAHRRLGAVVGPLQQRIPLQFFLDKGRQIEIGQLQQLDRLHQLRRHHQRLGLAEF